MCISDADGEMDGVPWSSSSVAAFLRQPVSTPSAYISQGSLTTLPNIPWSFANELAVTSTAFSSALVDVVRHAPKKQAQESHAKSICYSPLSLPDSSAPLDERPIHRYPASVV
jgi:hypothetical protein